MSENIHEQIPEKYTTNYALEQIEKIASQTEYLYNVISELGKISSKGAGDIGAQSRAEALSIVIKCRETTNQKLIAFYEKMYDDLKPVSASKKQALEIVSGFIANGNTDPSSLTSISNLLNNISRLD